MKHTIAAVVLCLLACVRAAGAEPDSREVVYWYVSDFPPYYILSGPKRGQGIGDKRREIIAKLLPEFRHEVVEAPPFRTIEDIRTKPNVCSVAFVKTPEREVVTEYSAIPVVWTLPNGVITLRGFLPMFTPYFNERGELRLDAFLAGSKKHRLGTLTGRSFGQGIDAVLKKHAGRDSIVTVPSSDQLASRLLKLANQREFEAILGYAAELSYVTEQLGLDAHKFVFLPVAEEPPLLPGYVGCSKSAFGKRFMTAVNRVIAKESTQRRIEAAYRAWLDDDSMALYDRLLKQMRANR